MLFLPLRYTSSEVAAKKTSGLLDEANMTWLQWNILVGFLVWIILMTLIFLQEYHSAMLLLVLLNITAFLTSPTRWTTCYLYCFCFCCLCFRWRDTNLMHNFSFITFTFGKRSEWKVWLEKTPLFVPWYKIQRNSFWVWRLIRAFGSSDCGVPYWRSG